MRSRSISTKSPTPPFSVTASGWAPPMPPSPAESTSRPASAAAEVLGRARAERLVRCPAGSPACRCRSTSRRVIWPYIVSPIASYLRKCSQSPHAGTSMALAMSTRGASAMRAEHADRLARLHEQRLVGRRGAAAWPRSGGRPPSCAPPCRSRRRRRGPPSARRRRGRGCSSACAARLPGASPGTRQPTAARRADRAGRAARSSPDDLSARRTSGCGSVRPSALAV